MHYYDYSNKQYFVYFLTVWFQENKVSEGLHLGNTSFLYDYVFQIAIHLLYNVTKYRMNL